VIWLATCNAKTNQKPTFEFQNLVLYMNKIVFLGSKKVGFSALNYLIKNAGALNIHILAVLSNDRKINQSDDSVLELASKNKIPILSSTDQLLSLNSIDFIVSVQYHEILHQKHIDCAKKLAINLHMAPVPEYRGCNQFSFAIIEGANEFGTTLHVLESGIDNGDILFEKRFPISRTETVGSLYEKTVEASVLLFEKNIQNIVTGNYTRTPQKSFKNIRTFGFHLRNEINDIKQIDLSWEDNKIDRYVRATYFPPFAPPFTIIDGKKIVLSLNWKKEISL